MAYIDFVKGKPVIADDGDEVLNYTRENLMALRDAIVMGVFVDWDMTVTAGTGTAAEPQYILWRSGQDAGTDRVRATITWGSAGGADGNPTVILYQFSVNGSVWDTIGTLTISYDVDANVTATDWS